MKAFERPVRFWATRPRHEKVCIGILLSLIVGLTMGPSAVQAFNEIVIDMSLLPK